MPAVRASVEGFRSFCGAHKEHSVYAVLIDEGQQTTGFSTSETGVFFYYPTETRGSSVKAFVLQCK